MAMAIQEKHVPTQVQLSWAYELHDRQTRPFLNQPVPTPYQSGTNTAFHPTATIDLYTGERL